MDKAPRTPGCPGGGTVYRWLSIMGVSYTLVRITGGGGGGGDLKRICVKMGRARDPGAGAGAIRPATVRF